jgi:hypothetical protein
MTNYDPNQPPQPYTPPTLPSTSASVSTTPGYVSVPADAQPAADGDRWAIAALAVAVTTLASCVIPGAGCLVPLIAGIITLTKASTAVDPSKARLYGWLSTGLGIAAILLTIGFVAIYGAIIMQAINEAQNFPLD